MSSLPANHQVAKTAIVMIIYDGMSFLAQGSFLSKIGVVTVSTGPLDFVIENKNIMTQTCRCMTNALCWEVGVLYKVN